MVVVVVNDRVQVEGVAHDPCDSSIAGRIVCQLTILGRILSHDVASLPRWRSLLWALPLLQLPLVVAVLVVVVALLIARTDVPVVVAVLLASIILIVILSRASQHRFLFVPLQLVQGVSSRTSLMRVAAVVTKAAIAMANPCNAEISIRLLAWWLG